MKKKSSQRVKFSIDISVLVRGAGDFASGIIHRLYRSGFRVTATELKQPLAVRRGAAFSEAVYEGTNTVEGVTAELAAPGDIDRVLQEGKVPVVIDAGGSVLARSFDIVVDARSAKRNLGTSIGDAAIVVAIGPGFEAGVDCHAVIETLPGAGLGRVIYKGWASADTATPSPLEGSPSNAPAGGFEDIADLVLRAPAAGTFDIEKHIGSIVDKGDTVGWVLDERGEKKTVKSGARGIVRGIIRDGTSVKKGMKLGDIDPTMIREHCFMISEKSRSIAGGVLEACMTLLAMRGTQGKATHDSS
jgi:xanthine dehydrogenase accessory factor